MTWHTFFDMHTLESRHLVFSYATVLLLQGGYFCVVVWSWMRTGRR